MLKIKRLFFQYSSSKIKILNDINLMIKSNTVVSLVGMNGAGKTTLLHCLLGINQVTSGEVFFQGKRIDEKETTEIIKKGIILVPEGRILFNHLTVEDNLILGAFIQKKSQKVIAEKEKVFQDFPVLMAKRKQLAGSLSGGEQQILAIVRALMSQPKLLILDEPTLGLSPLMIEKIFQIINRLKKKMTIFLIEQNAYLSLKHSNYSYLLENGKIVLEGKSKDLLKNNKIKNYYWGIN